MNKANVIKILKENMKEICFNCEVDGSLRGKDKVKIDECLKCNVYKLVNQVVKEINGD